MRSPNLSENVVPINAIVENKCSYDLDVREELLSDLVVRQPNELEIEAFTPLVELELWGHKVKVLLDSGCERSCINLKFLEDVKKQGFKVDEIPIKSTFVITAVASKSHRVSKLVSVPISIGGECQLHNCLVVPNLVCLFGVEWLTKHEVRLGFKEGNVCFSCGMSS